MNLPTLLLHHTLIICSKDRVQSLLKTLESVSTQSMGTLPSKIILVVNLKNESEIEILKSKIESLRLFQLKIIHTSKGLPSARNLALQEISNTDIVHFIDDDVIVDNTYFLDVERFFRSHPEASGGSPIGQSLEPKQLNRRTHFIREKFGLVEEPGLVTSSARNYWGTTNMTTSFPVNWLPGLVMFYKSADLENVSFEEGLEKCTLGGYGLGEDLLFTLQLSLSGKKLFAVPNIVITHNQLPNAANNSMLLDIARGELRAHLFQFFPSKFKVVKYLGSLILELVLVFFRSPQHFLDRLTRTTREVFGFIVNFNRGIHH